MQFNEEKFEMLRHSPNQNIKEETKLHTERWKHINPQPHVKCLRVHLSDDCSFQHHITGTVKNGKGMAGWVLRTFISRKPQVMLTLWKALLQPTLDYCTHLGSPHNKGDIQQLETVQSSFTEVDCDNLYFL